MLSGYLTQTKNRLAIYDPQVKKTHPLAQRPDRSFVPGDYVKELNGSLTLLDNANKPKVFDQLTPVMPHTPLIMRQDIAQHTKENVAMYQMASPLAYGTRSLIVAPPKSGKTSVLTDLVQAIDSPNLIILLVDERPEEVTEFKEKAPKNALVLASTFDEPARRHLEIAQLAIDRAKRLCSRGEDVIVIVDSLTRLCRAANVLAPSNGKIGSGGLVYEALKVPKSLLGMARQTREAGSITVIASCLVNTGSKLDEVIFEEFKGTGNSELILSRELGYKDMWPAVDMIQSGTRRDDLILKDMHASYRQLRRTLSSLGSEKAHELSQKLAQKGDLHEILSQVKS